MYLSSVAGDPLRLLIIKHDSHPKRGETLGKHFVRLNRHMLGSVIVLEMPEDGGELVCIHGNFDTGKAATP